MLPTDSYANPQYFSATHRILPNPAPATWLERSVARVRAQFGGLAAAATREPLALGVPNELRGDVITPNAPQEAGAPRFTAFGIEFRTNDSAQRFREIVRSSGAVVSTGRRRGINDPQPE